MRVIALGLAAIAASPARALDGAPKPKDGMVDSAERDQLTADLDAPVGQREAVDGHRDEALTITTSDSGVRTLSR